jgi:uncharacterized protein
VPHRRDGGATSIFPLVGNSWENGAKAFCRNHHIARLALFGSVLREDFSPHSDVDVLVEFEPGHTPAWEFFGMENELTTLFGRQVDLNTPGFLGRYFRDQVLAEAVTLYESQPETD